MEITNVLLLTIVALLCSFEVINAEENKVDVKGTKPFNPLEDLILNQNKNYPRKESLSRMKRQYGPYYGRRYPYPVPVPIIIGGYGGFGGGFGRGFGGRGFGGGGFGGRGGGFGGRGGGFGGRGGGFGGGRGGRG